MFGLPRTVIVLGLVSFLNDTASLLKLVPGRPAGRGWNHKGLGLGGYSVSNLARPLIGPGLSWSRMLLLRFLDRVGKGIRTSPRDALITASTDEKRRGGSFGFHRALDNAGAMAGPLITFGLLSAQLPLQHVFIWSLALGLMVLALPIRGLDGTPAPVARPDRSALR